MIKNKNQHMKKIFTSSLFILGMFVISFGQTAKEKQLERMAQKDKEKIEEFNKVVELTVEQKEKATAIFDEYREKIAAKRIENKGEQEKIKEACKPLYKERFTKMYEVFTQEQKKKWKAHKAASKE